MTTGWLTGQRSLCVLLRTHQNKHFLLVNQLVVPGLTAFSKRLCAKSLCAFFLPETFLHGNKVQIQAQGFLDVFFDAPSHLECFPRFVELGIKAAFAEAAFDTLRFQNSAAHKNAQEKSEELRMITSMLFFAEHRKAALMLQSPTMLRSAPPCTRRRAPTLAGPSPPCHPRHISKAMTIKRLGA